MCATWAVCEGVRGRLQTGSCACHGLGYAIAPYTCGALVVPCMRTCQVLWLGCAQALVPMWGFYL